MRYVHFVRLVTVVGVAGALVGARLGPQAARATQTEGAERIEPKLHDGACAAGSQGAAGGEPDCEENVESASEPTNYEIRWDLSEGSAFFRKTELLPADNLVFLKDGSSRSVDTLDAGDAVYMNDGREGSVVSIARHHPAKPPGKSAPRAFRVANTIEHRATMLVAIRTAQGEVMAAPEHPLYVADRGYLRAGDIQVGDVLQTADGRGAACLDVRARTVLGEPTFNLTLDGANTYHVGLGQLLARSNVGVTGSVRPTRTARVR